MSETTVTVRETEERLASAPPPAEDPLGPDVLTILALVAGAFWIGAVAAFCLGFYGPETLRAMGLAAWAVIAATALAPAILLLLAALGLRRARELRHQTRHLIAIARHLAEPELAGAARVRRVGRAVREEVSKVNTALDSASERVAALEAAVSTAEARSRAAADRLRAERDAMAGLGPKLDADIAAIETRLAARESALSAAIAALDTAFAARESALDARTEAFKDAGQVMLGASHEAAEELDRQAIRLEGASETAAARIDLILARQERQRTALAELIARLRDETSAAETSAEQQKSILEQALANLVDQREMLARATAEANAVLDTELARAESRTEAAAAALEKQTERANAAGDVARAAIDRAAETARAAADDVAGRFAGAASAAEQRLTGLRDALQAVAADIRTITERAATDAETRFARLPEAAGTEAKRLRAALEGEAQALLDWSQRMASAAEDLRAAITRPADLGGDEGTAGAPARKGLFTRPRTDEEPGNWRISQLLANTETRANDRAGRNEDAESGGDAPPPRQAGGNPG